MFTIEEITKTINELQSKIQRGNQMLEAIKTEITQAQGALNLCVELYNKLQNDAKEAAEKAAKQKEANRAKVKKSRARKKTKVENTSSNDTVTSEAA